jgi:hypothetical protein
LLSFSAAFSVRTPGSDTLKHLDIQLFLSNFIPLFVWVDVAMATNKIVQAISNFFTYPLRKTLKNFEAQTNKEIEQVKTSIKRYTTLCSLLFLM